MKSTSPASFCAVCTANIPADEKLRYAPLGKDDAPVRVCASCDTDSAVEGHAPEHHYEPQGGVGNLRKLFAERAKWKRDIKGADDPGNLARRRTPGWIIIRVPVRDADGRARDAHEIAERFEKESWAADVRYLGVAHARGGQRQHLFERPPVVKRDSGDPLAAIEKYRVHTEVA